MIARVGEGGGDGSGFCPETLSRCAFDASVAVKWYLPENHPDAAARWLARDAAFLAPET